MAFPKASSLLKVSSLVSGILITCKHVVNGKQINAHTLVTIMDRHLQ